MTPYEMSIAEGAYVTVLTIISSMSGTGAMVYGFSLWRFSGDDLKEILEKQKLLFFVFILSTLLLVSTLMRMQSNG